MVGAVGLFAAHFHARKGDAAFLCSQIKPVSTVQAYIVLTPLYVNVKNPFWRTRTTFRFATLFPAAADLGRGARVAGAAKGKS